MHRLVRVLNKLFNTHKKYVEDQGSFLFLFLVLDLQVYLVNLAMTSEISNVFKTQVLNLFLFYIRIYFKFQVIHVN